MTDIKVGDIIKWVWNVDEDREDSPPMLLLEIESEIFHYKGVDDRFLTVYHTGQQRVVEGCWQLIGDRHKGHWEVLA
jgi:hypothetical protein